MRDWKGIGNVPLWRGVKKLPVEGGIDSERK